jgi:CRISPR-associated protein Cas2
MGEAKLWYLVVYDIRDPVRWRKAYKLIRGFGTRLQYSVFRCRLSARQLEQLRWELEKRLKAEDSLLFIGLCDACVERITVKNRPESWDTESEGFKIL